MKKLEIEKKFLLFGFPEIPSDLEFENKRIVQTYNPEDGCRYRVEITLHGEKEPTERFIRTKKTQVSPGVDEEDEVEITHAEFDEKSVKSDRMLVKKRIEFDALSKDEKPIRWFVDSIISSGTILAEVELPSVDTEFEIPEFIKKMTFAEVTGDSRFKNYNLAKKKQD